MRPILHGDVSAAARVLLAASPADRDSLCVRMIHEAELADQHVVMTGRLHPDFGNGSLQAAARSRRLADEPSFDCLQYCECMALVLHNLMQFQSSRMHN